MDLRKALRFVIALVVGSSLLPLAPTTTHAGAELKFTAWTPGWTFRCLCWSGAYKLKAENVGDVELTSARIWATVPANAVLDDSDGEVLPRGWVYHPATREVVWDVGTLAPGESFQVNVELLPTSPCPWEQTVTGYARSDQTPEKPASATVTYTDVCTPAPGETQTPGLMGTPTPTLLPSQQQIVLRNGAAYNGEVYEGTHDTFLDGWDKETNHNTSGRKDRLEVREGIKSPLVHFDLPTMPESSQLDRATLLLYVWSPGSTWEHPMGLSVYEVYRHWNVDEANYRMATDLDPWAEGGCERAGSDRATDDRADEPVASHTVRGIGWYAFDISSLVQQWLAAPETNNGVIVKGASEVFTEFAFASAESGSDETRPHLGLIFTRHTPTPTDTATATATATSTATATPHPTTTSTHSPTPDNTATPTSTATPTPIVYRLELPMILS